MLKFDIRLSGPGAKKWNCQAAGPGGDLLNVLGESNCRNGAPQCAAATD